MSPFLEQVLRDLDRLTPSEQLEVIGYATQKLKRHRAMQDRPRRSWRELRGIAPNLLDGRDAQEWVSQLRGDWDGRE